MVTVNVQSEENMSSQTKVLGYFTMKQLVFESNGQLSCSLTDSCLHLALLYLFRKAACEVRKFVNKMYIDKVAYEVDGLLLSKGRLLDGMSFLDTGEFENFSVGDSVLPSDA